MQLQFENFSGNYAYLNGSKKMKITRMDLCRCVMQVGYKNYFSYASSSIYKRFELFFMVMANIKYINGELMFKDAYYLMDQSEKVGISYQIGQGLAKAVAEWYFDVPWAAHFSVMKKSGYQFNDGGAIKKTIVQNSKEGKEPDLIGYDKKGQIHLFESKGTANNKIPNANAQKAINQVSNYISVTDYKGDTQDFVTRNACLFTYNSGLRGTIIDPSKDDNEIYMKGAIGYMYCIYNYYYDFLYNYNSLDTIHEAGRIWRGYTFSINNKKLFWGIDSEYLNFLNEQFSSIILGQKNTWGEDVENKGKEMLAFLSGNGIENKLSINNNDDISVGSDGVILINLDN